MLNDPEIDKLIIYALLGMVAVLGLAVIVLGVKKNTYYVDEDGEVISPVSKRDLKKKNKQVPRPVYEEEEEDDDVIVAPVTPVAPVAPVTPVTPAAPLAQATSFEDDPLMKGRLPEEPAEEAPVKFETLEVPTVRHTNVLGATVTVTINGESHVQEVDILPCLLGRDSSSCGLVISEPAVSRRHARFFAENGSLYIEDVSEHNGTYLNGAKLPPLGRGKVHEGDRINLGRAEIRVDRINY